MNLDDIDEQFVLEHLLFKERTCRSCKIKKNLIDNFYRTRKDRIAVSSSYSYECKECTIKRIQKSRKKCKLNIEWDYPDW
jgi:hypothetical protein